MPPPGGTSTSDSSTQKASAPSSTYHASSSRFRSPDYPKPDSRSDRVYRTRIRDDVDVRVIHSEPPRLLEEAQRGKDVVASSLPPRAGRRPHPPHRRGRDRLPRAGPAGLAARRPRRAGAPAALARAATGARGAGLTPTLAGDAGVSSTQLGKRQPTAGRAAGRPRAGSSSRGGSSLGLGRPDRRS